MLNVLGFISLLAPRNEHVVDVGHDSPARDGYAAQQRVELLVVADRQLDVARNDPGLFVVFGSVSCELHDLSCKILEDGCQVDWRANSNALGELSFP